MTDVELFDCATLHARSVIYWRGLAADEALRARSYLADRMTSRQCLHRARVAERRVFDLSITAEKRAEAA